MRGFGGNGPYTVIVAMLCFGVGLDAIYLERPVWEVDVGGRRPRPLPQQSFGGPVETEQGDWNWNNPDLMYYQPEYNSAEEYGYQQPDSIESKLSERTHFQEAQQASQMKKPAYEAEEQVPYLAPRPYPEPKGMEQDREDGWVKQMLYQPNWQTETAPARPFQPPQQLEQQSRPPKPIQMPPRVPGDRQPGQWAEKGPEYDAKESSPSSTADRLLQLQMLQQQQWMQEQQLKQQELAQQQNQLRQQEMLQQQLKQQQQQLQQQQEQQLKLQQQKLKQQQEAQRQQELKQQEEEKKREQELLERQKELKRQQEQQRQQELIQQQQEMMRQRELQRQQELQQQQQLKQQELQQQEMMRQQQEMMLQQHSSPTCQFSLNQPPCRDQ
ncbi:hypothetical protein AND_002520 [Anopheles darlingi]|uniref:Uncharacterized protein n=1 Tax=Anopheles darlingi TaxID=43151 RepID=W5JSG3_ANODA|nr:hypothetical protein AND_002520 [Anopheles darlingi]